MEKFVHRIQPPSGFSLGLKELWHYRELFYFFTWRDIKVKYKQTYLGILWALIQPLGLMLIFTLVFSRNWRIDTFPVAYPVFVLSGVILWTLFNASVSHAGESMLLNAGIIKKIYFPRLIIPASSLLVALFDFIMGFLVFLGFCILYKQPLSWTAVYYFPAALLLLLLAAFGLGSFLSALNVKYRDFRYTVPFLLQFMFFASQVIYPLAGLKPLWLKTLLQFNPVNAAIELFRAPFTNTEPELQTLAFGSASTLVLILAGLYYFRKTEAYFADLS